MKNCLSCSSAPFRAFSLVEMLMALLVASLLMAALAPVITRKLNDSVVISGSGENIIPSTFCGYVNDTVQDQLNEGNKACRVPQNTYSMNAIIVSGGGGGAGALGKIAEGGTNSTYGGELQGRTGINGREDNPWRSKEFLIDKYVSDIWVEFVAGGAGGGYGNTNGGGRPGQQSDCGNWGVYVKPEQNGNTNKEYYYGTCVSRQNPGESLVSGNSTGASPDINVLVSSNRIKKCTISGSSAAASGCSTSTCTGNCCWVGATAGTKCKNKSGYTYSGCNRTVCQWNAGRTICANWKPVSSAPEFGRLPSGWEYGSWAYDVNATASRTIGPLNKGAAGLQLCSGYDIDSRGINHDAPYCAWSGACTGANGNTCFIHASWSSSHPGGDGSHWHYDLGQGSQVHAPTIYNLSEGYTDLHAFSVRCVLDRISEFKGYTGGGGSGGLFGKVKVPDYVLKKAFIKNDGTVAETIALRLIAGGGGSGGTKEKSAVGGWPSGAEIVDANGNVVWKVYTGGGGAGSNASGSVNGNGGKAQTDGICGYVNAYLDKPILIDTQVECSTIPDFSFIAATNDMDGSNNGTGGKSYWNGAYTQRTPAGSADSLDGGEGGIGSGGGGGICIEGPTRLTPQCGNGGSGGPGMSKFTYKRVIPGVGGGGGAAGTLLHVKNIQVRPNDLITVQVGAKGMQGAGGANGKDGGTSYIQLSDGTKYQVLGGGGGKTGTAGNPSAGKLSIPGKGGTTGGIETKTKTYLNNGDEYYPKNPNDAKGADAPENDTDMYKAAGGNGGINAKTSLAAGESENRIPCGGFSTTSIVVDKKEYKCETEIPSFKPFALTRAINPRSFSASVIQNYYLGATGGGGGGWLNDYSSEATIDAKSSGADGMGGYVFIYFGSW